MSGNDQEFEFRCPCGVSFTASSQEGKHQCVVCHETLWYVQTVSVRAVATSPQLESAFGFDADDFNDPEMLELLGRYSGLHDDFQQWSIEQQGRIEPETMPKYSGTINPYQPPSVDPARTDSFGDSFVLVANCPCDETSLRWAHRTYVRSGDAFALCMILLAGIAIALVFFLESWIDQITARLGKSGWIGVIAVAMPLWYLCGRLCLIPLGKTLDRRAAEDPLLQSDWFWLIIRRRTLTASDQQGTHRRTWPLKNILPGQSDSGLLVLRTDPGRKLFITGAAQTSPESFEEFCKAVKKRLRKFWREHLKSFRLR